MDLIWVEICLCFVGMIWKIILVLWRSYGWMGEAHASDKPNSHEVLASGSKEKKIPLIWLKFVKEGRGRLL